MNMIDQILEEVRLLPHSSAAKTLDVRIGPFWTVCRTSVGTGVASTLAGEARPHEGLPVTAAGRLHLQSPLELAELLRSGSTTESAVGLAAINALLGRPEGHVTQEKALAILTEHGRGKKVAMIGRFPFAETLRSTCGELVVFERNQKLGSGVVSSDDIPELMPQAEVVAITATTLINGTLNKIMRHIRDDAWVMMLGPSTPMTPCLFNNGFDVLCGTLVVDPDVVINAASQGGTTKQITGVERLSAWRPS